VDVNVGDAGERGIGCRRDAAHGAHKLPPAEWAFNRACRRLRRRAAATPRSCAVATGTREAAIRPRPVRPRYERAWATTAQRSCGWRAA
jgi:hypothetical protein